jgi:hypothetical protein
MTLGTPSVSATANSVAKRDGSGSLFGQTGTAPTSLVNLSQLTAAVAGLSLTPSFKSASFSADIGFLYNVNGSSITATLEDATTTSGMPLVIYNSGSADVTVATVSAQTISGTSTLTLAPADSVQLESDGANWVALSSGSGGGGGSGTVNSGTATQLAYYASNGSVVSGIAGLNWASNVLNIGDTSSIAGTINLYPGSGSGSGLTLSCNSTTSEIRFAPFGGGQNSIILEATTLSGGNCAITFAGTSGGLTIRPAATGSVWDWTLPSSAGTNLQFLQTNGSGISTWANVPIFTTSVSGSAPASGGGTTNFLRADGAWIAPSLSANPGNLRALSIVSSGRQLPTSGTINGTYWHYGSWTQSGDITAAHGTRIYVNGAMTFVNPWILTVSTGLLGGSNSTGNTFVGGQVGSGIGGGTRTVDFASTSVAGGAGAGCGGLGGGGGSATSGVSNSGGLPYTFNDQFAGSGGGGGDHGATGDTGGFGGAGGGAIYIECTGAMSISGSSYVFILANGGNGASAGGTTSAGGGGGGSGGIVVIRGGSTINLGSFTNAIQAIGGGGGSGFANSGGGGGGGGGIIDIVCASTLSSSLTTASATGHGTGGGGSATQPPSNGTNGTLNIASTTPVSVW